MPGQPCCDMMKDRKYNNVLYVLLKIVRKFKNGIDKDYWGFFLEPIKMYTI